MRRVALALLLGSAGCGESAEAPRFELRAVVAPALARLEAALETAPADPAAAEADARETFEALLGPLRSDDPDFRALALEDARHLPPAAVELVAQTLLQAEEPVATRVGLADALGVVATPRALDALLAGLTGADEPVVRAQCAYRLGRAADERVVPALVLRLKYEKDFQTVYWIADALARLGHLAGIEPLLVVWAQATDETREHAAARLLEIAGEHRCADVEELRVRWREGRLPSSRAPSPALELEGWHWIARLAEWQLRGVDDARYVLVALEDWIVPNLAAALHDENVYVRLHAAQCLERRGKRAAGAAAELEAALAEPRIAAVAASALAASGATGAVSALERAVAQGADPELVVAAARALGGLGLARSIPVLETLLSSAATLDQRQAAAEGLLALDAAPAARELLIACLLDPQADSGAAEVALGAWLRKAGEPAGALIERWDALAPVPGTVPGAAEVDARRSARAKLLRELVR